MPGDRSQLFTGFRGAVALLAKHFGGGKPGALGDEDRDTFSLSREDLAPGWLANDLLPLAEKLLELRFEIVLTVAAHRISGDFTLDRVGGSIEATPGQPRRLRTDRELPPAAEVAYKDLRDRFEPGAERRLDSLLRIVTALEQAGVRPASKLRISLDKKLEASGAAQRFAAAASTAGYPRPIVFLYPEKLADYLGSLDLETLESQCFQAGQRTVFVVFDLEGGFGNELLEFVGSGREERLDRLLADSLPEETVDTIERARALQKAGGVWLQQSLRWLTPDLFEIGGEEGERADPRAAGILRQLRLTRALLASIFLADHTEISAGETHPRVRYRGYGQVSFQVSTQALAQIDPPLLDDLFGLYRYAYEGYSVDKLEIAQRFLSLLAKDLEALCAKAADVKGATKQTYERALQDKVGEYFDARHKLQERIKTAVAEASDSVLGLTREVSSDLYKVAGLVVAAIVGAFLKPELSELALKTVGLGIGIYAAIVLALHLSTMRRSYRLRMDQHVSYIKSFRDVLREGEIDGFVNDPELDQSRRLLDGRLDWATLVYIFFLLAGLFFVVEADRLVVPPPPEATGWPLFW